MTDARTNKEECKMDGFHIKNGWYFRRHAETAAVEISIENGPSITIDKDGWASIVTSVSANGENATTFRIAEDLHKGLFEIWDKMSQRNRDVLKQIFSGGETP